MTSFFFKHKFPSLKYRTQTNVDYLKNIIENIDFYTNI